MLTPGGTDDAPARRWCEKVKREGYGSGDNVSSVRLRRTMSGEAVEPSRWACDRFGAAASELAEAVTAGVRHAHALALDAHLASTLKSNDAYGYTLRVTVPEQLVEFTRQIPGVDARKPTGVRSRFPYVLVEETQVVLLPWRYATDVSVRRIDAKLPAPISDLRKTMLGLSVQAGHVQPTLDDVDLDADELEVLITEEQDLLAQLRTRGAVVTVAFASNPVNGVIGLGWGDAELTDAGSGEVTWRHWEGLTIGRAASRSARPAIVNATPDSGGARFDDAPLNDDLGLSIRSPLGGEPVSEPHTDEAMTGTDADDDGNPAR